MPLICYSIILTTKFMTIFFENNLSYMKKVISIIYVVHCSANHCAPDNTINYKSIWSRNWLFKNTYELQ